MRPVTELRIVEALESDSGPHDPLTVIKEVNGELRPEDWRTIGHYDNTVVLGIGHPMRALILVIEKAPYRECQYISLRERKAWIYAVHGLHRDVRVAGECKVCTAPWAYQDAMPVGAICVGCGMPLGDPVAIARMNSEIEDTIAMVDRVMEISPLEVVALTQEVPNGL